MLNNEYGFGKYPVAEKSQAACFFFVEEKRPRRCGESCMPVEELEMTTIRAEYETGEYES